MQNPIELIQCQLLMLGFKSSNQDGMLYDMEVRPGQKLHAYIHGVGGDLTVWGFSRIRGKEAITASYPNATAIASVAKLLEKCNGKKTN